MDKKNQNMKVHSICALSLLILCCIFVFCRRAEAGETDEKGVIKVGLLFSSTGSSSGVERSMINAAQMAFDEINANGGVDGKPIEYILEDYSSDPAMAEEKIFKLITQDHVVATIGCYSSASRKATLPVLDQYNSVLIYPAYTEGKECDTHVIYTGAMPNQQSEEYIHWLLKQEGKHVYLVGNDYLYPVTYNKIAKEIIDAEGGKIVGESYVGTGEINFETILMDIEEKNPDFIYCDLIGDSLTAFYTSYQKMGFSASDYPIASVTTDEMVLKQIGADAGEGHYCAMSYFSSVDTVASRTFVERYGQYVEDDSVITSLAESTYSSCYLLAKALTKAEEPYDAEQIIAAFSDLTFDAPQGTIHVDASNHCTWLYSRFAVIHDGAFQILYESETPIAPDPGVELAQRSWKSYLTVDETYDVFWMPLLLLPMLCVLLCRLPFMNNKILQVAVVAAAAVQPFFLTPYHGFANSIPSLMIAVWSAGMILMNRTFPKGRRSIIKYTFQIFLITFYISCGKVLYHLVASFNTQYFCYAFSYLPDNIINANITILSEMLCLDFVVLDLLLTLPVFKQEENKHTYDKHMYILFAIVMLCTVVSAAVSTNVDEGQLLSISVSVNSFQSQLGNAQFLLLKEILVWGIGCLLAHYMDYYYLQESDRLEMAETQRAIFESSSDMIWSISGTRGTIVTSNQAARDFFEAKDAFLDKKFLDIWDKNELDEWADCIEKAEEKGEYRTEYYNADTKKYYNLTIHRVDLNAQEYDIAFFAKDVTEETELNDLIQSMNDELENRIVEKTKSLEEANKNLGRFSYMVAHELKAPIRAIRLYNEMRDASCEEIRQDCTTHIDAYCEKSIHLINGILEYTKSQETDLIYARINMSHLVKRQIEENIAMNGLENVEYKIGFLPNILGDEALMNCCVNNIISNSLKYSRMREKILLEVFSEKKGQEYIFHFKDNGIGFSMQHAGALFHTFSRLHHDSEFEGTGVGLATVRNIIERHGGWVKAAAKPGEGCTITFGLPV